MLWCASAAESLCLGRGVQSAGRRRSGRRWRPFWSRSRSSFSFSLPRPPLRWRRPLSPAPMTRRSPPSLGRSLATRRNSAPMPTIIARQRSMGPAIAANNVSSAGALLRLWRLCRRTCRPCPVDLIAGRTRYACRPARTFVPPIPPSQIRPGPLPSQSDGHPSRAFRRAFAFLQTRGFSSCRFSISAWPRARLPARSLPWEMSPPTRMPSAATASFRRRSPSTIPASPTN